MLNPQSFTLDRVKKNSPAEQSGLRRKDRLLAWNGSVLKTWDDFSEFIKNYKNHPQPFELSILRGGVEKKLLVHAEKMSTVHSDGNIEGSLHGGCGLRSIYFFAGIDDC